MSTTYVKKQAFVMMHPLNGCVTLTQTTSTVSAQTQILFTPPLNTIQSLPTVTLYYADNTLSINKIAGASSKDLVAIGVQNLPSTCTSYQNMGTISVSTISSQTYTVSDSALVVNGIDFSYSVACYDAKTWVYTATMDSGAALPSFITFTQNAAGSGFKFSIYSTDNAIANSYNIKVTGVLRGLYSASTSFTLTVVAFTTSTTSSSTSTTTTTTSTTTTSTTTTTTTTTTTQTTSTTSTTSSTTTTTPAPTTSTTSTTSSTSSTTTSSTTTPAPATTTETTSSSSTSSSTSSTTPTPVTTTDTTTSTSSSTSTSSTSSSTTTTPTPTPTTTTDTTSSSSTSTTSSSTSTTTTTTTTISTTTTTPAPSTSSTTSSSSSSSTTTQTTSTTTTTTTTTTTATSSSSTSSTTSSTSSTSTVSTSSTSTTTPSPTTTAASSTSGVIVTSSSTTSSPTTTQIASSTLARRNPEFVSSLPERVTVYASQQLSVDLPAIRNQARLEVGISMSYQLSPYLPSFISCSKSRIRLSPQNSDVGEEPYIVQLYYKKYPSFQTQYLLIVEVLPLQAERDRNKPNLTSSNQTDSGSTVQITKNDVAIQKVNSQGVLTITFSREIMLLLNGSINATMFEVYTGLNPQSSKIKNWTLSIDSNGNVLIQMIFQDPDSISLFQDRDFVTVVVKNKKTQPIKLIQELPPQYSDDDTVSQIDLTANIVYNLVASLLYSSFLVSILGGSSLQWIWSLINTLQLITHTPLFNIPYTIKLFVFLRTFFSVATFDLFDSQRYLQIIFGLADSDSYEAFNARFNFLGYDSNSFIYLVGPPLFYVFYYIFMSMVYVLFFKTHKGPRWRRMMSIRLQKQLYMDSFLAYFLETCLEAGFSAVINFMLPSDQSKNDFVSTVFSVSFLLINALLAIILPIYLSKFVDGKDEHPSLKRYYSEVEENLNLKTRWATFYYSFFIVRRFLFITTVFKSEGSLTFQIRFFIICNILYLSYLLHARPLKKNLWQEVFNEATTLVLSSLMIVFNDFVLDTEPKQVMTDVFIAIFLGNIVVNLAIIVFQTYTEARHKMRMCLHKRRLTKLLKGQTQTSSYVSKFKSTRKSHKLNQIKPQSDLSVINEERQGTSQEEGSSDDQGETVQTDFRRIKQAERSSDKGDMIYIDDTLKSSAFDSQNASYANILALNTVQQLPKNFQNRTNPSQTSSKNLSLQVNSKLSQSRFALPNSALAVNQPLQMIPERLRSIERDNESFNQPKESGRGLLDSHRNLQQSENTIPIIILNGNRSQMDTADLAPYSNDLRAKLTTVPRSKFQSDNNFAIPKNYLSASPVGNSPRSGQNQTLGQSQIIEEQFSESSVSNSDALSPSPRSMMQNQNQSALNRVSQPRISPRGDGVRSSSQMNINKFGSSLMRPQIGSQLSVDTQQNKYSPSYLNPQSNSPIGTFNLEQIKSPSNQSSGGSDQNLNASNTIFQTQQDLSQSSLRPYQNYNQQKNETNQRQLIDPKRTRLEPRKSQFYGLNYEDNQ